MRSSLRPSASTGSGRPRVSVVIPVLDEAASIQKCVDSVRAAAGGGDCEVVVVDGDPGGTTLAALDDGRAATMTAPRGRGPQMNAGAARAGGDVLLFLHADTLLPATAFDDIAAALADPRTAGGAFAHRFDSPKRRYRVMSACITALTRTNRLPYGDQAIFLRRATFDAVGGFAPVEVMEDWDLVRRIKRRGDRLRVLSTPVRTSARRLDGEGAVRRVVTNWWMCLQAALGVPYSRLARLYRPHGAAGAVVAEDARAIAAERDNT